MEIGRQAESTLGRPEKKRTNGPNNGLQILARGEGDYLKIASNRDDWRWPCGAMTDLKQIRENKLTTNHFETIEVYLNLKFEVNTFFIMYKGFL